MLGREDNVRRGREDRSGRAVQRLGVGVIEVLRQDRGATGATSQPICHGVDAGRGRHRQTEGVRRGSPVLNQS